MNLSLRILALLAIVALAGCSKDQKLGMCPSANVLSTTALASVFRDGRAGDPAGVLYKVEMTGVRTNCDFDKNEGTTDSSVVVTFRATRAPTGTSSDYSIPYYVAVTRDSSTFVSKQTLSASFSFRPGESSTTFTGEVPSVLIRLDNGKKPYDYGLLTGLQLTQAQLDYNKKMGRFAP